MTPDERNRVIVRSVATFLAGVVLLLTLYQLREVLMTLYISSLLAIGLSPIVRRIERDRIMAGRIRVPRWAAILALYVTFLAAVALLMALIVPPLVRQIQQLVLDLPTHVDRLQAELVKRGLLDHTWSWSSVLSNLKTPAGIAISGLFGAVTGFVGIMAKVITILLLPFYLLLEAASLRNGMLSLVHPDNRARAARIARHVTEKVGAWLGGQFILATVIGSTATAGLLADRCAVLLRARTAGGCRRIDPGGRPDPGGDSRPSCWAPRCRHKRRSSPPASAGLSSSWKTTSSYRASWAARSASARSRSWWRCSPAHRCSASSARSSPCRQRRSRRCWCKSF